MSAAAEPGAADRPGPHYGFSFSAVIGSKRIVEHRRTQDPSPPQEPEPRKREPVSNPNANAQTAQADARNPDSAIVPIREFSPRRFRQAIRPIEMQFRPREFVAIVRPLDAK